MTEPYHDPETLQKLYVGEELSQEEIGDRYGVSRTTICRWLQKHEIEKPYQDKETLERLYLDDGLSQQEIAERFDVHRETIGKWIRKREIMPPEPYKDKETLERLYLDEGLFQKEIADELGVHESTIREWLKRYDIEQPDKPYKDPDTLYQLFVEERLSTQKIGEKFGVDRRTIGVWIRKHDIERPEAASYFIDEGYPKWCSQKDELKVHQLLAIHNGEDPHNVFSGEYHTHHKNGIRWANWHDNIELMTNSEHMSHHQEEQWGDKPWRDKGLLWNLYVEESMSLPKIAEELECSASTIETHLHKFDIPLRNYGGEYEHEPHPLRKW